MGTLEEVFDIELVSRAGSPPKPMTLIFDWDGIAFQQPDGEVFIRAGYNSIQRWKNSCVRSSNKGESSCLDIQLKTSKGPQILRVKGSGGLAAFDIQNALKKWVKIASDDYHSAIYEQVKPLRDSLEFGTQLSVSSQATIPKATTTRTLPKTLSNSIPVLLRPPLDNVSAAEEHNAEVGKMEEIEGMVDGAGDKSLDRTPTSLDTIMHTCNNIVQVLSSQEEEFQAFIGGEDGSEDGESHSKDKVQIRFLEDMVNRLSSSLARTQKLLSKEEMNEINAAPINEDLAYGVVPPAWLTDAKYISPLLSAYDARIEELTTQIDKATKVVEESKTQASELIKENEELRERLSSTLELMEKKKDLEKSGTGNLDEIFELEKRCNLLGHENSLLMEQQKDLEKELEGLEKTLQKKNTEMSAANDENLQLLCQMQSQTGEILQLKNEIKDGQVFLDQSRKQVSHLEDEVLGLSQRLQKGEKEKTALERSVGRHDIDRENDEKDMESLALRLKEMQRRVEEEENKASDVEQENGVLSQALTAMENKVAELQEALHLSETSLHKYQQKDSEAFLQIKECTEAMEEAKLARDAAIRKEIELSRELDALNQRLATQRMDIHTELRGQHQKQTKALEDQLDAAEDEARRLKYKVSDVEAANQQLLHEKELLEQNLEKLKQDLSSSRIACGVTGVTVNSLEDAETVQKLEHDRQEALEKLASSQRAAERMSREWEFEKRQLEGTSEDLKKKVFDLHEAKSNADSETTKLQHKLDVALRQATATKNAKGEVENDLRSEIKRLRLDHEKEIQDLSAKMERVVSTHQRQIDDAEALIDGREVLISQWKEEAIMISRRFERQQAEREEAEKALNEQVTSLQKELKDMRNAYDTLVRECGTARQQEAQLRASLGQAVQRVSMTEMMLIEAKQREEEHEEERRELTSCIDRANIKMGKMKRERDAYGMKFESIRRKIDNKNY